MEILNIDPRVLILQIGGFALLLLVFKKFLYRPILGILRERQEQIRDTYAAAESEQTRMEELRADYERRIADIEAEARQKIQASVKEAQEIREHILQEARHNSDKIIFRAEEEIAREREKALVEIRQEVVNLTVNAASKLIGRSLDDATNKQLVDDFISSIEARQ